MENAEIEEFINAVRARTDIYEVVSRYVPLTMKSGRFWACCPFHEEKTPSFSITPERGMFYCFGCHEGGDSFKFISLMEHITYFEAVKLQAERLGIKLPSRKKNSAEIQAEQSKNDLLKITSLARDFYRDYLIKSNEGAQGRKYLAARGISEKVVKDFQIGFAPNAWDALTKKLISRGYSERQLISAGLAVEKKNGEGIYDRLRGRVIIPICDTFDKVVAFGGRILVEDENSPKYLNTPETEIFSKGKLLFALNKSSRAIISANTAIVVEGYMDAISLISAGIENVVASLGTAFTEEQAKLLARHARRIIFCYDSDEAGQRATVRALQIMKNSGAELFILIVPDGKDPDEFIRKHGKAAFEQLIKNVMPVIDFQFQYKLKRINYSTFGGKLQVLREMFPLCRDLNNALLQGDYFKKFSSALVLDEGVILKEWEKFLSRSPTSNKFSRQKNFKVQKFSLPRQAGRSIIQKIWYEPEFLDYLNAIVPRESFIKIHIEIINYIEKCYAADRLPNNFTAEQELSEEAYKELIAILAMIEPQDSQIKAFQDSVKIMQRLTLENLQQKITQEAKEFFKAGDLKSYEEKLQAALNIQKEISKL